MSTCKGAEIQTWTQEQLKYCAPLYLIERNVNYSKGWKISMNWFIFDVLN